MLKKNFKILVAGKEGMVGSAICRLFKKKKIKYINCSRKNLDFLDQEAVNSWFKNNKPDIVINAAGKVGGILDNSVNKSKYIYENIIIGFNLINNSYKHSVKSFINLGSACIYPKFTKQPIKEDYLLSGHLEPTNEGYAIAKIATLKYCQFLKEEFNLNFISLQPANLYGINDNYDLNSSHVIPALVRKFHEAKINGKPYVEVWGSGKATRDFLYVDDLAEAIIFILKKKISYNFLNVAHGKSYSIKELAYIIKKIIKFEGKIKFNKSYSDGTPERELDISRISSLGWKSKTTLIFGLNNYYKWFVKNFKSI